MAIISFEISISFPGKPDLVLGQNIREKSQGHLEKLPFRPISASQANEKCSHMTYMLCFLISLFLGVCAYLTSNENSNFSRHP